MHSGTYSTIAISGDKNNQAYQITNKARQSGSQFAKYSNNTNNVV